MKKIDIDKLEVSSKLDDVINGAVSEGYKNINAEAKKKSTNSKMKKSIIAASIAIGVITTGVITTPVIATNIPIIGDIYRQLGYFNGFEDYTKYIGESKESNGYKVTIENIVGTPNDLLVGIRIESPVPFNKDSANKEFSVEMNMEQVGIKSYMVNKDMYYIDDYTAVITSKIKNVQGNFKKYGDMTVIINKLSEVKAGKTNEVIEDLRVDFNIKVDFSSSFNKREKIKVNDEVNKNIKINNIESSVIGTQLVFDAKSNEYMGEVFGDIYYLEVNNEIHSSFLGTGYDNTAIIDFPTAKYDYIKNAESINVICVTQLVNNNNTESKNKIELATEHGITYPKTIVSNEGLQGGFYKVEKEKNKLKAYFKSDYNPLLILNSFGLYEVDENEILTKRYQAKSYKNEDKGYTLEFDDVNFENPLKISYEDWIPLDESYEIKTIKVK